MFKTIFTSAIAGLAMISSAYAGEKVDVIQYTKAGAQADRMITYVQESLGENFGKRIVVDNCAAAKKVLSNTSNPTVVAWMTELNNPQADGSPNTCALADDMFVGYLAASPWSICHRTDNAAATLDALKTGDIRVGVWRNAYYNKQFEAFLKAMNPNAKMIPYKKGSEYRAALAAGELDFSISTLGKDGETCPVVLSTTIEGSAQATITASELAPGAPYAVSGYNYTLWAANMDGINIDLLKTVYASNAWKNRKDSRYHPFMTDATRVEQLASTK